MAQEGYPLRDKYYVIVITDPDGTKRLNCGAHSRMPAMYSQKVRARTIATANGGKVYEVNIRRIVQIKDRQDAENHNE